MGSHWANGAHEPCGALFGGPRPNFGPETKYFRDQRGWRGQYGNARPRADDRPETADVRM